MITSTANWMANPAIQAKKVGQLVLPGTHDSGTFSLSLELSQMEYENIKFLWKLSPDQAPKALPDGSTIYVGPEMYGFVFRLVKETAQAHDRSIIKQLNEGIRYFDFRVYWDTFFKDIYFHHGLRGAPLSQAFNDVAEFISQGGHELIFLEVSHTNFSEQTSGAAALVAKLDQHVGRQNIYVTDSLDALGRTTLSAITGRGSRVIVLNTSSDPYPSGSPVLTTPGFQDSGRSASGVNDVSALADAEAKGLAQQRTGPFYKIAWTLTPQLTDIINGAVARVEGVASPPSLKALADTANAGLQSFVEQNKKYPFNLITVDWYQDSPVVNLAIELSLGHIHASANEWELTEALV